MRSRYVLLKLFLNEAVLELALVWWLGSRVVAMCPAACSCSPGHREVDCSWRGLRQLPDSLQHNLHSLNLSHNRFHDLDGRLTAYTHLRVLDLSHNRLSRLPADLPRSLWQLHAASNRIQLLDKNDTVYQWNLRVLNLSHNKVERAIFINNTLSNLRTLNLSHNHFWTLPTNLPAHLEAIDLSHNLLVKVLPGSLDRLPMLTHFYLHANRFSTLPPGVLDKMASLRVLSLGDNPWACHLYNDIAYILSWSQLTPAHVLGCPCHTRPVCGGVRPSRTSRWHFGSYNLPPLAAGAQEASSTPSEAGVTGWWYMPVSALLSTPKEAANTPQHTFTAHQPISISTETPTRQTVNHRSAPAGKTDNDHMWHADFHLTSGTKEASPTDSPHAIDMSSFSDTGLISQTTRGDDTTLAGDRFFATESSFVQTKKTTTLRTRSVRRQNQSVPRGISNDSPTLPARSFFLFLRNPGLVVLILSEIL